MLTSLLHETEKVIQKFFPFGVPIKFVQLQGDMRGKEKKKQVILKAGNKFQKQQ